MTAPRNDKGVGMNVRLPADVHVQLCRAAEERCLSRNYIAAKAIEDFLGRLIPVEEWSLVRLSHSKDDA